MISFQNSFFAAVVVGDEKRFEISLALPPIGEIEYVEHTFSAHNYKSLVSLAAHLVAHNILGSL